jgi:hypothetical protein
MRISHEQSPVAYTSACGAAVWIFIKFEIGETLWIHSNFILELTVLIITLPEVLHAFLSIFCNLLNSCRTEKFFK